MTRPIDIDVVRLEVYLLKHIKEIEGPIHVERFNDGQSNPTYAITDRNLKKYVLRKKPGGQLLPSAHAIEREYRVITALRETDVPVPKTYCLCTETDVIGTPFFVMEFVTGRILWDPALPGMTPSERGDIYNEMNRVIGALHRVDVKAVDLTDYGKSGQFFQRQILRWTKQYAAAATETIEAMDRLGAWLASHIPANDETKLFHGDLRLDNLVFHPTKPKILAVLDWELSTLGHPFADFAYHALPWRLTAQEFRGMRGTDYIKLGIPTEQEYLKQYCAGVGQPQIDQREWEFYLSYSMFRLAAILQGILNRSLAGNASSANAREIGEKARGIANVAWAQVQENFPDSKK